MAAAPKNPKEVFNPSVEVRRRQSVLINLLTSTAEPVLKMEVFLLEGIYLPKKMELAAKKLLSSSSSSLLTVEPRH